MNYTDKYFRELARMSPLDVFLADVVVRIQLTPTDHNLAIEHYHAIHEWIEREESPLCGLVEEFYPQGGFSIGATVARHDDASEFDIDTMAQLALRAEADPEAVLALLDEAIRSTPGTKYHEKASRKGRCSTVQYDGMHLDVTPTVRLVNTTEKTGSIFQSKPKEPGKPKKSLLANPYGFAHWFNQVTAVANEFGTFFEERSLAYDRSLRQVLAKADAAPVPDQAPAYRKSRALVALQLIKRWRNLAYDKRHANLKMPPSVLLAFLVASHANTTTSLSAELLHQVESMIEVFTAAQQQGRTLRAFNPACQEDELTDRWPPDLREQQVFIDELNTFAIKLYKLMGDLPLAETQKILEDLFGEKSARIVIKDYVDRAAKDAASTGGSYLPGKAAIPAALTSVAAPSLVRAAPPHKFYGDVDE